MMIAIFREARDLFVVLAHDKSDAEMLQYDINVLYVVRNDPLHGVQYRKGDTFTIMKRRKGADGYVHWDLSPVELPPGVSLTTALT